MGPKVGSMIYVQSFKHDGTLHRTWSMAFVIEATAQQVAAVTNKTWVTESDGRKWYTREPAICFFYPDHWFNIICMLRKTGVYYYCNLASPAVYDGEALKHIDYDLDVKVYPNGDVVLLDEDEYLAHGVQMGYSSQLKQIIGYELKELYRWIAEKREPFDPAGLDQRFAEYLKLLEANNRKEYLRVR